MSGFQDGQLFVCTMHFEQVHEFAPNPMCLHATIINTWTVNILEANPLKMADFQYRRLCVIAFERVYRLTPNNGYMN